MAPWILAALLAVVAAYGGYRHGVQYQASIDTAATVAATNAAAKAIAEANDRVRAAEKKTQDMVEATAAAYEIKLKEQEHETASAVAKLRNGQRVLYAYAKCPANDSGASGQTAPATSVSDGTARVELSPAFAGDLWQLAADADRNTDQLTACQQVLLDERK